MPRHLLRFAGVVLVLSFVVPIDTAHDGARFVHRLAIDVRPEAVGVLLAPTLCGALLIVATVVCRREGSLALATLASIAGLFVVTAAGAAALAWDLLPLPDTWRCGPGPGLCAVALTVAAVGQPLPRRRALLAAALPFAVAHLVVPWFGEAPLGMTTRVLAHVAASSGPGNVASAALLSAIVLWPGLAPLVGWIHAGRRGPRSPRAALVVYGLPAVLSPLAERALANPWGSAPSHAAALGAVAVLAAVLLALADAAARLASAPSLPGRAEARTGLACLAAAGLAGLCTARGARPAAPDVSFVLGPPVPAGDRLFGTLLPRWNDARAAVDLHGSGAEALALAEGALLAAAPELGAEIERALRGLVSAAADPDRLERSWYARVEGVNEALRREHLPYYVDPTEAVATGSDAARWFRLDPYRIEAVRRFAAAGRELATLHVRALAPARTPRGTLGLSRDVQPFAVVALDGIADYQQELEALASETPPRCAAAPADAGPSFVCGALLARLAGEGDLGAALVSLTDRHELQHQLDAPALTRSGWLERRLAFRPPEARARVARELSAYLAQMTAPGPAPRLTLVRLLRMVLVARRGVEHETARLALEAMGLAVDDLAGPASLGDEALRARGEEAWAEIFGRRLPRVEAR